jgi:predicted signal transduction protein with EAL and GGDEF domain
MLRTGDNDVHSPHIYFFAAIAVIAAALCAFFLSSAAEWWEFVTAIVMGALAIAAASRAVQALRRARG